MPTVLTNTNSYTVNHGYPDIHPIFDGYNILMSDNTP